MPMVDRAILFIEDTQDSTPHIFERDLQALMHWSGFEAVVGLVIGRFQRLSGVNSDILSKIINLRLRRNIPVLAGLDFGHTDPKFTFPIGGEAEISALEGNTRLRIIKH
jgi:muramoyltetrapeptide carboxypeptidase LdcA involved in peptidoglycan recycling